MKAPNIPEIYQELTARYYQISSATIKDLLKGRVTVTGGKTRFGFDKLDTPSLDEVEDAFRSYNCAIFTAFRGGNTLEENLGRNEQLKADMMDCGLAFRPVRGCYREADWEYANVEYCFFVYHTEEDGNFTFFEKVFRLSAKYDQDSFLYKRAGINRSAFLVATTEAGRGDLEGNIKFAGQLHMDVPDVEAWTDCSDGRFAFQLKGMVITGTKLRKISRGEGDIFDTDSYHPDGLVIVHHKRQTYLRERCRELGSTLPIASHQFVDDNQSETSLHRVVMQCLKIMADKKCKTIGLYCTATINGSRITAAQVALDAIKAWAKRHDKRLKGIVIVDAYGDFLKAIANSEQS